MIHYRQPKKATFVSEDWLVWWFDDISRWAKFYSELDGLVDDTFNIVSEDEYMAWYSEIARSRVGKPTPVPPPQYSTRELYDSMEGYRVMVVGLNMFK